MNVVPFKMLVGDRAEYLGIITSLTLPVYAGHQMDIFINAPPPGGPAADVALKP